MIAGNRVAFGMFLSGTVLYTLWWLSKDILTTDHRFRGIIFGHSFVFRFGNHLNTIRGDERRTYQDLLGLSDHVKSLQVIGESGAQLDFFEKFFEELKDSIYGDIDFLVVDMGSNDLDNKKDPQDLANSLVGLGHQLIEERLVKCIVFLHVAARNRTYGIRFATDRRSFNDQLTSLVQNEEGMSDQEMTSFNEETIDIWSSDGIHANTEVGHQMYFNAIQRAVWAAIKICS